MSAVENSPAQVVPIDEVFVRHRAQVPSLRVLVADGDLSRRAMLRRTLERAGHRVHVALDGEEAIDLMQSGDADLVVVDGRLSCAGGLAFPRRLRSLRADHARRVPLIVLAEGMVAQAGREAADSNAQLVLARPVGPVRVLAAVARLAGASVVPVARLSPALDELAGLRLSEGFLHEFVEQCIADAGACVGQLREQAAARSWADCRETAHALKGIAESLGYRPVAERCEAIVRGDEESLCRDHARWIAEIDGHRRTMAEQARRQAVILTRSPPADEASGPEPA